MARVRANNDPTQAILIKLLTGLESGLFFKIISIVQRQQKSCSYVLQLYIYKN